MMFDLIAHADWSIVAAKRWVTMAHRREEQWCVEAPANVLNCVSFISELFAPTSKHDRRLFGFDFPIGVPANYGRRTGFLHFRELLSRVGSGAWAEFFNVAAAPAEISLRRPFFPFGSNNGAKQHHLLDALDFGKIGDLLRQCDRRTPTRRAACPLFWTLGAQQVGKAAISGWREVVRPALAKNASLWPFDGRLSDLAARGRPTICETYPAEAYAHIGFRFGNIESKTRQADRASKATAIFAWTVAHDVTLSPATHRAIIEGFGPSQKGEDAFDSLVGLLGMIEVVEGRRSEGPIDDPEIQQWEGWILGQSKNMLFPA